MKIIFDNCSVSAARGSKIKMSQLQHNSFPKWARNKLLQI